MTTPDPVPAKPGAATCIAAIALLAFLCWKALAGIALPGARPAGADAHAFSAEAAMRHVATLAATPRPIATPANARTRQYLLDTLRAAGLQPEVQAALVQHTQVSPFEHVHVTLARVQNVVARIEGSAPDHAARPALLLVAGYDSGPATYGAARGAASAAAMLETIRALRAGPAPQYDIVFLFADGEMAGGLGARAFVEQHPLAARIGVALRFDNPGNAGPLVLYGSSRANNEAIGRWARSMPAPVGSSLMEQVYRFVPGHVGLGALASLDAPVLHFATVGGTRGERLDTTARLDRSSLQHEGDAMLAMAREFSRLPASRTGGAEQVYFSVPGIGVIHYPASLTWTFTRLACLLLAGACLLAFQRARLDGTRLVKATFGFSLIAVALPLLPYYLWLYVPSIHAMYTPGAGEFGQRYLLAVAVLGLAVFILLQRRLQRAVGAAAAGLGALLFLGVLLVAASWLAPAAAYVLVWPLFAGAAAFALLHSRRVARLPQAARLAILLCGLLPALFIFVPLVRDIYAVTTPHRMNLPFGALAMLLGFAAIVLAAIARRFAVRLLAAGGLGLLTLSSSAGQADAPPEPNPLIYYKDMPTWRAWWLAPQDLAVAPARRLFPNLEQPRRLVDVFGWDSEDLWYAPAGRDDSLAFPRALLLRNDRDDGRVVEFQLESKNRAPEVQLWIVNAKPKRTRVNGLLLTDTVSRSWSMSLYGLEDTPMLFTFEMAGDPTFVVRVEERIPGLPAQVQPPGARGDGYIPMTGMTVSADTLVFR